MTQSIKKRRATTRRGRPPAGKARLSREIIVEAAISLVEKDGLEAATMRGVARQLRVDGMSIYNHVASHDELLDAITEHVLTHMTLPTITGALGADVRAIAGAFRDAALKYPRCASLVLTRQSGADAALAPTEVTLAICRTAGFSSEQSVHIVRSVLAYVVGSLLREASADAAFSGTDAKGAAARRDVLSASGLPQVAEAAAYLSTCRHDQEFNFGLDLMITALEAKR